MIRRIPAENRHFTNDEWLKTYWLFSFSDYYDPKNLSHGALRVFNDDTVMPKSGFPNHPHSNFEIITIVLEGELTHRDSAGHRGTIKSGDVQRMSAGTGIVHSELNLANTPVHLYQIWIQPDEEDLEPSYDQRYFNFDEKNRLVKLVSPDGKGCLSIHSNSTLYRGSFEPDQQFTYSTDTERKIFIYPTDGEIRINNELIRRNDQARIEGENSLLIETLSKTNFVLIDTPEY
jgi:quercetin 2,3-dioxygenase